MHLPSEAIQEFQKLYQKEFGISLGEIEAIEGAEDLLRLVALAKGQRDIF